MIIGKMLQSTIGGSIFEIKDGLWKADLVQEQAQVALLVISN
jgi:hypothetical protein